MIRLSDLIQKYDGTNIDYIEKQKDILFKKSRFAAKVTIAVSVFLIVVPVVLNIIDPRDVKPNRKHKSDGYKIYQITTIVIFGFFSALICYRLRIILKNIRRAFA